MRQVKNPPRNPRAMFTDEQVLEIKDLLKAGERLIDIAAKFKCHKSTISDIKTGKSYFGVRREPKA